MHICFYHFASIESKFENTAKLNFGSQDQWSNNMRPLKAGGHFMAIKMYFYTCTHFGGGDYSYKRSILGSRMSHGYCTKLF